jgi:CPA2 family monovalent cation:H+ antiporter-2
VIRDIALVLTAALVGGALARLVRQPLFVGYVLGGLLVSPFTPGPAIRDVTAFATLAQIGVVLVMFSVGIELSLHEVTRLGRSALVGAPLVMGLTILGTGAAGAMVGWPARQSLVVGIVLSVASTMVVAKLVTEHGETHAPHARLALGTALMEDLVVVVLIALLTALAGADVRPAAVARGLGRAVLVLGPLLVLATRVVPAVLGWVARTRNTELLILVAVFVGIGAAALAQGVGLSLALGAFVGGLVISESPVTHEVLGRVLPVRDLFAALFFVSVGTLIQPQVLTARVGELAMLVGLIVGGKFALRLGVLRWFGYPWPTAALASAHLAQTGEFSFVLAQVALAGGLLAEPVYQTLLAASLLSILLAAGMAQAGHRWIDEPLPAAQTPAPGGQPVEVVICGFGRLGSAVAEALEAFGLSYAAVDLDGAVVDALRRRGIRCVYGDAASEAVLRRAGAKEARLAVVALPDSARARLAVRRLKEIHPALTILARAPHPSDRAPLLEAGAAEVIQPEFEAAQTLLRHGLEILGVPHPQVKAYMEQQRSVESGRAPAGPGLPLTMRVIPVGPGAWRDRSLRQARIRERTGAWILAVRRRDGSVVANPPPDTVLWEGDEVTVVGLPEQVDLFEALNRQ